MTSWSLRKPFFSLDDVWAYDLSYGNLGNRPRYFLTSSDYIRPQANFTEVFARVRKLIADKDSHVWRLGGGFKFQTVAVHPENDLEVRNTWGDLGLTYDLTETPPENRKVNGPFLFVEKRRRAYFQATFIDQMGRLEDHPRGHEVRGTLGWSGPAFDGDVKGPFFELLQTWRNRHGGFFYQGRLDFTGLVDEGDARDLRLVGNFNTTTHLGRGLRLATGLAAAYGQRLDSYNPFVLGLERGLRSAGFREFTGDRLLRANLELRWYHEKPVLSLLIFGAAVFYDVGTTWYEDQADFAWDEVRDAAGIGLRFALNRGTFNLPVRADLAWTAFGSPTGADPPVFSLGTGHAF